MILWRIEAGSGELGSQLTVDQSRRESPQPSGFHVFPVSSLLPIERGDP